MPCVERYAPHLAEEVSGVAEGAGLATEQVMLINVRNQLGAAADGCTSVVVEGRSTAAGTGVAGQNWDNDPATDPFSVVLTRRPEGKPATLNFTRPGEIGYMGLSSAGIGILMNAMPGRSRRVGVPWYFIVRRIYEQESLAGAIEVARAAKRAIPANAAMVTPDGAADLEVMVEGVRVLGADERGRLVHTNHCVHPDFLAINESHRNGIYGQSFERRGRAGQLLDQEQGKVTVDTVKKILSDHEGHPTSICRHPNDDPATGWQRSVVSMIVEPGPGRMHLSRGNPCENTYELYELGS
jgi:isopenicillin-N N-acyltransferase-like protein